MKPGWGPFYRGEWFHLSWGIFLLGSMVLLHVMGVPAFEPVWLWLIIGAAGLGVSMCGEKPR